MERGGQLEALMAVLDRQVEAGRRLLDALSAERAAMTGDPPAALDEATRHKDEVRGQLEQLEQERRRLAAGLGIGPEFRDLDAALARATGAALPLRQRWEALTALLAQCRDANETNGLMLVALRRRTQQALNILRGEHPDGTTYGPAGAAAPTARPGRGLGRV